MRTHHPGTDNPPIRPSPKAGEIRTIHDDVPLWNDTPCCCEPEPRWQAVREELEREQPGSHQDASKHSPPNRC